jgi:hypothetical protein
MEQPRYSFGQCCNLTTQSELLKPWSKSRIALLKSDPTSSRFLTLREYTTTNLLQMEGDLKETWVVLHYTHVITERLGIFHLVKPNSSRGPIMVRVAHDLHIHSQTQADIRNAKDEQGNKSRAPRLGPSRQPSKPRAVPAYAKPRMFSPLAPSPNTVA